jgi:hypothetical protein
VAARGGESTLNGTSRSAYELGEKSEKGVVAFDAGIKQFFAGGFESETGIRSVHPAVSKWRRTDCALVPTATTAAVDDAMSEADTPEREVRIRAQAYQLWEDAGRPERQSDYFWYRAEDLIRLKELDEEAASAFVVILGVVFSAAFLCIDHISEIAATARGR